MKSTYYVVSIVMVSLFISGCGKDRSHGVYKFSELGVKNSWITDSESGKKMLENNFVYIPGGFDVDEDGVEEGGFWLSVYEAKESNSTQNINMNKSINIQDLLMNNFKVFNASDNYKRFNKSLTQMSGYLTDYNASLKGIDVKRVVFNDEGNVIKSVSPVEAVLCLQNSQIQGGYDISLPSEKQWMQLVKLVINNPKNWTGEEVGKGKLFQGNKYGTNERRSFVIENSLLGEDVYVPKDYKVDVYDLSGGIAEWTTGMIAIEDRFLTGDSGRFEYGEVNNAPLWWKPILKNQNISLSSMQGAGMYHDGFSKAGTNDTLEISSAGTGNVDSYAVVARGGSNSIDDMMLVGIGAAKLSYGPGYKGPTVGFRAASGYF